MTNQQYNDGMADINRRIAVARFDPSIRIGPLEKERQDITTEKLRADLKSG